MERTLILVKPDAFDRGLSGEIISRFERKGLRLTASRVLTLDGSLAFSHYAEHVGKPFFASLVQFITSGPVLALVFEGESAIDAARQVIGATDPLRATPGTIRGDYGLVTASNLVHGSDSPDAAEREIALYFPAITDEPRLYVPVGIPGSGKTHWTRQMRLGQAYVSSDAIRDELRGSGESRYQVDRNDEVFATFHRRIGGGLADGYSVVADATNLSAPARSTLRDIAAYHGVECHLIVFTNLVQALSRNAARKGDDHVPDDAMKTMLEKYEVAIRDDIPFESYDSVTYIERTT